jgi:hypothetical protein
MECRDRMPGCVNPPMGGNLDVRHLCPRAPVQGMGAGRWAHGVVVSHPFSMREALGSIPSVSSLGVMPRLCDWPRGCNNQGRFGCAWVPWSTRVCDS